MSRRWLRPVFAVALLSLLGAFSLTDLGAQLPPVDIPDEVQARAAAGERVPIIVGVRAAFQPEGELANATAVADQQARIRTAQDGLLDRLASFGVTNVTEFQTIPFVSMTVDAAGLAAVASDALVTSIEPDALAAPTLAESVPLIGANLSHAAGFTGAGTGVAVLDTGVETSHPFLGGRVGSEACYSNGGGGGVSACPGGVTQATGPGTGAPCNVSGCDHGTHVAGIAAGNQGVAPGAGIVAIQVFTRFNDSTSCGGTPPCALAYTTDQVLGLERVLALRNGGAPIVSVNMSLGGGRYYDTASCDAASPSRLAAFANLRSVNVAPVVASGNNSYPDSISMPGCLSNAVSVGSTTDAQIGSIPVDTVSTFSNRNQYLSIMAPGQAIVSSVVGGAYASKNGTSMATPHVAGAWAVLRHSSPSASVAQVLAAMQATGVPVNDPLSDPNLSRPLRVYPRLAVNAARLALAGGGSGVPGPPINAQGSAAGTLVTVTWNAPATGGAPQGYLIDAGTGPGLSNIVAGLNVGNTLAVQGNLPAGTYYIRVRAFNTFGPGASSNEVVVTVGAAGAPGPPLNLAAAVNGSNVTLTWSAPNTGGSPTNYLVDAGTAPGASNLVASLSVGNVLTVQGVLPDGIYYARVRAQNGGGTGPFSNEVQFTIGASAAPGAPSNLVGSVLSTNVNFTWNAPTTGGAPTGYRLEAGSATGLSNLAVINLGNVLSFFTPAPGGTFFVRVRAFNSVGVSPPSNEVVVVLVTGGTCTGDFSATLTWNTGPGSPAPTTDVDMDLHVREPSNFHVYYAARTGPTARLDFDNTSGFGPENVCVNSGAAAAGTYAVHVAAYSGNQWPTTATIVVRAYGTYRTFFRTFTGSDFGATAQNVANVTFPGGVITETTGTRVPDIFDAPAKIYQTFVKGGR